MSWMQKLSRPLCLKSGVTVATLGAARQLIADLPADRKREETWEYAAKLLLKASEGSAFFCEMATDEMERALKTEKLI